jgi:methyl-accepting chemotaxis protein
VAKIRLRIGGKLGLLAGLSIVLVAGTMGNEQVGQHSMADSAELVQVNYLNLDNAQAAGLAMVRARVAVSELVLTDTVADADKSAAEARTQLAAAEREFAAAQERARRQETKDLYRDARVETQAYLAATLDLAAAQKQSLAAQEARRKAAAALNSAFSILTESPRLAGQKIGAVEEQSAATREISQNVQMASHGTQTLSVNISSVSGAIKETNHSAAAVLSSSTAVSTQADRMAEAVKAFFVALRTGPLDRRVADDANYKGQERRHDRPGYRAPAEAEAAVRRPAA